jgi:hypothetical protein
MAVGKRITARRKYSPPTRPTSRGRSQSLDRTSVLDPLASLVRAAPHLDYSRIAAAVVAGLLIARCQGYARMAMPRSPTEAAE